MWPHGLMFQLMLPHTSCTALAIGHYQTFWKSSSFRSSLNNYSADWLRPDSDNGDQVIIIACDCASAKGAGSWIAWINLPKNIQFCNFSWTFHARLKITKIVTTMRESSKISLLKLKMISAIIVVSIQFVSLFLEPCKNSVGRLDSGNFIIYIIKVNI